jgi:biopolymer transport protein ExbB
VWSLARTFGAVAAQGLSQAEKQRVLSNGIAEATYDLGFMLVLAAPLLAVSWWAKRRDKK